MPCKSNWKIPSHVLEDTVLPPDVRKLPGRPPSYDRKNGFNRLNLRDLKCPVVDVVQRVKTRRIVTNILRSTKFVMELFGIFRCFINHFCSREFCLVIEWCFFLPSLR